MNGLAGLVVLVQMGVLEFHPWHVRADNLEHPDVLVFDLDPGEGVAWSAVVHAARAMRDCDSSRLSDSVGSRIWFPKEVRKMDSIEQEVLQVFASDIE